MRLPIYTRHHIPFFHDKTEKEFKEDNYEHFDPMVIRQSALHLMDELWGQYPMQGVLDFSERIDKNIKLESIVEIGCGVGRWIGNWAQQIPEAECWGIDYSYQMLKRAREVWVAGDEIALNLSKYGFAAAHKIQGQSLSNLQFGLAKATTLPFEDQSQDLVLNSFLFDRLNDPQQGLKEMYRILRPGGHLLMITPLNFFNAQLWSQYYPPIKIHQLIRNIGFEVLDWQEDLLLDEPLDIRGNIVRWKCIAIHAKKAD